MSIKQEPFYSFHTFLYPFQWDYTDQKAQLLEEKTNLDRFQQLIHEFQPHWKTEAEPWFPPKTLTRYNEVSYFYDFVHGALYDQGKDYSFLKHYHFDFGQEGRFLIHQKDDPKPYNLELDDILLHLYNTGVGVLSFHLYNRDPKQADPEDILRINQFGRRMYPPFFGTRNEWLGEQRFFEDTDWHKGLLGTKNAELPDAISLQFNGELFAEETFHPRKSYPEVDQMPAYMEKLFSRPLLNKVAITPVLDDRMFVMCWYGHTDKAKAARDYRTDDWLYRFTFVDGRTKTCQNAEMAAEVMQRHVNPRWSGYCTLYGVSRYSFMCLTNPISKLRRDKAAFVVAHMQTIYYKLVELCLVQRACLLRFSEEVTSISRMKTERNLTKRVGSLYKQYLRFVNKIYFREITAQEQGIELYDMLKKHMRTKTQVEELEQEIKDLYQYVSLQEEEKRNRNLELITVLGAAFVVPSFLAGYFGMNIFDTGNFQEPRSIWYIVGSAILLPGILILGIRLRGVWRWIVMAVFFILMVLILLGLPRIMS